MHRNSFATATLLYSFYPSCCNSSQPTHPHSSIPTYRHFSPSNSLQLSPCIPLPSPSVPFSWPSSPCPATPPLSTSSPVYPALLLELHALTSLTTRPPVDPPQLSSMASVQATTSAQAMAQNAPTMMPAIITVEPMVYAEGQVQDAILNLSSLPASRA